MMPRRVRYIYPGLPHHAIQRGNNRQKVFRDEEDRRYYLGKLNKFMKEGDVEVGAYCLMPNHVHLLIYPKSREGLIKFMKQIHQMYSQYFNWKYQHTGKLWENRYKLHIAEPEAEWVLARYIEKNPIRAGMVHKAEEYCYLSLALFRAFGPYFQVVLVEKAILWYRKPVFAIRETFPTTNSKICQTQVVIQVHELIY